MADIRINALATTAASTASDDFVAVDGSANGTRKLNVYSPTFGGNLTVSGTATIGNQVTTNGASAGYRFDPRDGSGANWLWYNPTGDDARLYNTSGAGDVLTITNAGAATLSGNLTVSGTGTSSVAGSLGIGNTNPVEKLAVSSGNIKLYSNQFTAGQYRYIGSEYAASNGNNKAEVRFGIGSAGDTTTFIGFAVANGAGDITEQARLNYTGNLLIGTTTDGGQKLQVSGTGYLSDSLRVGTSFTPTAWGVKAIEVNDAGGGLFAAYYGGAPKGYMLGLSNGLRFNGHSSSSRIDIMDAGSIIVATSNTTALTLDSSQRCILAGALRLNNAYVAGAPTATGYVTIQDSAGNTYKVLVGT